MVIPSPPHRAATGSDGRAAGAGKQRRRRLDEADGDDRKPDEDGDGGGRNDGSAAGRNGGSTAGRRRCTELLGYVRERGEQNVRSDTMLGMNSYIPKGAKASTYTYMR